ncbi:hypothetical protein CaCOL14_007321 [Colletotrichum acutatum]
MDPIFPSIDPQTLEIIEPPHNTIPQPSPPELDDLLLSERQQLSCLSGLRTWEAAVLAKTEAYTVTGEEQAMIGNEIQVDESSWLPVWSKDRWMIDFTAPPNSSTNWSGSHLWSAHDPIIWGILRKAIQIADNILRKSLEGDWLQSLLIPENIESHDTTLLSGSTKIGRIWRMKSSPASRKPAKELIQLLSCPSLLNRVFWTFNDKTTLNSYQPDGITKGLTAPYDLSEGPITVFVNILGIKTLLDADATQSSKSAALVCLADTHVIGFHTLSSEILLQKLGIPRYGFEIFGPQEHQCELGWSFEQHAFGGTVFGLVPKRDGNFLSANYAPLILSINRFPYVSDPTLTYDFLLDSPTIETRWPLSSLWHTSLSSEPFWTQIVSKYGYSSLKAPKMLEVTRENGNRGFYQPWIWAIEKSARFKEDFVPRNYQANALKMSARSLQTETAFNTYASLCIEPPGLRDAFVAECTSLRAQLDADFANGYTSWLDFRFSVPQYPGQTYDLAELYDHAKLIGDELILVENGHHLDVHKCSAICRSLELDEDELPEFTKPTFYGTQLTDDGVGCLHEADIPSLPLGRVVRVLRGDDIAQCDGTGGEPLWIRIHNDVFDITYLKCVSEPGLRRLLANNSGGDPSLELLQDGYSLEEIKKSLTPWRVGMLAKTPGTVANKHSVRTFTPQSLRRHEFEETGMYVVIENKVYNITNYAETHPGGLQCLVENGGRDITDLFNKYHQTNRNTVLKGLQELYIGNLIEQRQEYVDDDIESLADDRPVLPHEIRFGKEVYSVKALRDSEEHGEFLDLADALSPYLGLDATEALQAEEYENGPLMRFACLRGYIVATVKDVGLGLPEIEPEELRMFDGHTDESCDVQYDAFVASNGFVYDLTSAMLYGSFNPIYSKFKPFLGGIVADEELRTYLDTHCENLICAILVQQKNEGDGRRIVNWDPRKKVAPRYKMPIWANRPRKIPKPPAEDEIAPHIDTKEKAKETSKEEVFETKEVFEPTPTATFLQNMINQLDEVNQPSFAMNLEEQEDRISCTSHTKGKQPESKASSSKVRQLSRLEADLRRRKDEKVMRKIARTWQEVIASDESTLPAAYPLDRNVKRTDGVAIQEQDLEKGERSAQQDAAPSGMSRRALEVIKKRKPVFEIDEGPPRKRR